jgi:lipoate-protein ligase A
MWSQTPQFDLLLNASDDIGIKMNVHHGIIKSLEFEDSRLTSDMCKSIRHALVGQRLQDIRSWSRFLQRRVVSPSRTSRNIANRLDELLPIPELFPGNGAK